MHLRQLIAAAAMIVLVATPTFAQNTLYFDDFNGAAGVPLHGTTPDINGTGLTSTWLTRTDTGQPTGTGQLFFANGAVNGGGGGINGSATLPFTPTPGAIYTLTARLSTVTSTANNWIALGFTAGQSAAGNNNPGRFIGPGGTAGQPWMLYRGTGATLADTTFLGPGTGPPAGLDWALPVTASHGAPADLRIILNTTAAAWTATWQAKNVADANFTTIRTDTYATNPTIGGVGIAIANTDIVTTISSFRLETNASVLKPGDVNGDGQINIADFNIISDNLFNTPATRAQGDLDGNTTVDFVDFRLWKSLAGAAGAGIELGGVPEPTSLLLGGIGFLWFAHLRRRERS